MAGLKYFQCTNKRLLNDFCSNTEVDVLHTDFIVQSEASKSQTVKCFSLSQLRSRDIPYLLHNVRGQAAHLWSHHGLVTHIEQQPAATPDPSLISQSAAPLRHDGCVCVCVCVKGEGASVICVLDQDLICRRLPRSRTLSFYTEQLVAAGPA